MSAGASIDPAHRIELLNRVGQILVASAGSRAGYPAIAQGVRSTLGLEAASLWVVDVPAFGPTRAALDVRDNRDWSERELEFDESLVRWQFEHHRRRVLLPEEAAGAAGRVISLPVKHRDDEILGALNLYVAEPGAWLLGAEQDAEAAEFLRSVAGQVSVFIEKRLLEAGTTLYKEVHHRVKNNLQTVASLLRMQIRRLDTITAEQALEDSIHRIQAIALVHETLSHAEIGLVDFGELIGRIARLLGDPVAPGTRLDLRVTGPAVMLDSRQATAAALVANELVANALTHGVRPDTTGVVRIALEHLGDRVLFSVEDEGPGLPPGFDARRDRHLGLSIVTTLVEEELQGLFQLTRANGTRAQVAFPLPRTAQGR
jgi:two-component sensor histidine kinase